MPYARRILLRRMGHGLLATSQNQSAECACPTIDHHGPNNFKDAQ